VSILASNIQTAKHLCMESPREKLKKVKPARSDDLATLEKDKIESAGQADSKPSTETAWEATSPFKHWKGDAATERGGGETSGIDNQSPLKPRGSREQKTQSSHCRGVKPRGDSTQQGVGEKI